MKNKMNKKKLLPYKFNLSECKAELQIIEGSAKSEKGYGTVFLNIQFPDGRWIAFKSVEGMRVAMYKEEPPVLENTSNRPQEAKE